MRWSFFLQEGSKVALQGTVMDTVMACLQWQPTAVLAL
jgi:hypothetical protein